MSRLLLPLFVLLPLSSALPYMRQSRDDCPSGGMIQLHTCFHDYISWFNFTDLPHFGAFEQVLGRLELSNGAASVDMLCNQLQSCLQTIMGCFTPNNLQSVYPNITFESADAYYTHYFIEQYKCGDGMSSWKMYFYCLAAVETYHMEDLFKCDKDLEAAANATTGAPPCSIFTTFINCKTNIYQKNCGMGPVSYVCNIEELEIQANAGQFCADQLPQC